MDHVECETPTEQLLLTLIAKVDDNAQHLDRVTTKLNRVTAAVEHRLERLLARHESPLQGLRSPDFIEQAEARQIRKLIEDKAAVHVYARRSMGCAVPNVRILFQENIQVLRRNGFTVKPASDAPLFGTVGASFFDISWPPASVVSAASPA